MVQNAVFKRHFRLLFEYDIEPGSSSRELHANVFGYKINGAQWSFSNLKYVEFIESLEQKSRWKYSGESELLLIDYRTSMLNYSSVLSFNLDAMLRDEAIPSINAFFEVIFREANKRKSVTQIGVITEVKALGQITIDSIVEALPSFFRGLIKKERHYLVNDYSKT